MMQFWMHQFAIARLLLVNYLSYCYNHFLGKRFLPQLSRHVYQVLIYYPYFEVVPLFQEIIDLASIQVAYFINSWLYHLQDLEWKYCSMMRDVRDLLPCSFLFKF